MTGERRTPDSAGPEPLLLGIDIGTSSAKGVLVTPAGEIVARASRSHATSNPRPGWFEHDAETVWWQGLLAVMRELLAGRAGPRVAALAVSGIGPCLLPADSGGRPLRPAILYGIDSRAGAQIAQLNAELGPAEIRRAGGSILTSQAVGPKLLWLRQAEPDIYRRTRQLLSCSSFLVGRLTGSYVLDHHSASQFTPLYDLRGQRWHEDWCDHIAPGLPLPRLYWPTEVVGSLTPAAAEMTGLPAGIPVTAGTIDAWAEAASVGVRQPGDVMVMYGTTMFLVQVLACPASHPGLWSTAGIWPGSYTLAAGMATSGALTNWLRELTSADFPELLSEAAQSPPGANGLLLLPYFAGERTPLFDPDARGVIAGLTLAHSRGDLYRAALEGTAYGVRHNLEAMIEATAGQVTSADPAPGASAARSGANPAARATGQRLVAVGGGTQGGLWLQIVSDVTGRPQELHAESVGACLGDAMLAGIATGLASAPDRWNPCRTVISPDPDRIATYDLAYADYRQLYTVTSDITHRLAATQARAAEAAGQG